MDPRRDKIYDPTRPWATTDALLGILARTLQRPASHRQSPISSIPNRSSVNTPDATSTLHLHRASRQASPKGAPAVTSQFWTSPHNIHNGLSVGTEAVSYTSTAGPLPSLSTHAPLPILPRPSPALGTAHELSGYNPRGENHFLVPSRHGSTVDGRDSSTSQAATPGQAQDDMSPMMADHNLPIWQGGGHDDEQESFLHQYSDMGGDYSAVPTNMLDPTLAMMHDHEDFVHERDHISPYGEDELEGGHLGAIPFQGRLKQSLSSPFFQTKSLAKTTRQPSPRRPPRGTVSCIPFPRLTAPTFGLIQEQLAHEPFRLLIAVTFLIRTTGRAAIPTFHHVMQRFSAPEALADDANTVELTAMIRHLGLSSVRAAAIRRYARGWLKRPPQAGVRFRVRNYATRMVATFHNIEDPFSQETPDADLADLLGGYRSPMASGTPRALDHEPVLDGDGLDAWEIGHLTQGQYTIDSWRIFCRDVLLGKATDWRGGGREAEFQPEWMRVLPRDKELRACLRWMWMREGWLWDPATGEREVLSGEMRTAVEEGRVVYNDEGGLEIVGQTM